MVGSKGRDCIQAFTALQRGIYHQGDIGPEDGCTAHEVRIKGAAMKLSDEFKYVFLVVATYIGVMLIYRLLVAAMMTRVALINWNIHV